MRKEKGGMLGGKAERERGEAEGRKKGGEAPLGGGGG